MLHSMICHLTEKVKPFLLHYVTYKDTPDNNPEAFETQIEFFTSVQLVNHWLKMEPKPKS